MLFNSLPFLLFLPIVFALYWLLAKGKLRLQNLLLLIASYVFYGWWDWRFLSLIFLSTLVDYISALKIYRASATKERKVWLWVSLLFNLGMLGFFKYYNFFAESWAEAFSYLGFAVHPWTLNVILPVGISFYTFQTMSYSIDIYKNKLIPTKDFIGFAAFVSFFPQLVAGPIERASHLLPQILQKRKFTFEQGTRGIQLILWGFFKKVVIADSMAPIVDQVYGSYSEYSGFALGLATLAFSIQIFCDFSGYSDIAIGIAKLFGIELMNNFEYPYLARNIGEFWRKWHISLSTWFRDYVYIPMGGSRVNRKRAIFNVFIVFLVSGLWHGANWTFVAWGGIHAALFIPVFLLGKNKKYSQYAVKSNKFLPAFKDVVNILFTFSMVTVAWIFFRADTVSGAVLILKKILMITQGRGLNFLNNELIEFSMAFGLFFLLGLLFLYEKTGMINFRVRHLFLVSIILLIFIPLFGKFQEQSFIYFQF